MKLYRIISNGVLSRREKEGQISSLNLNDPVVELRPEKEDVTVEEVVPINDNFVLDTNDSTMIAMYKSKLKTLINETLQKGYIQEFRLIREDDFFPYDWVWRVNSNQTASEYAKSKLSYSLRMAEAHKRASNNKTSQRSSFGFLFPGDVEAENKEAAALDPHYGQVYEPTKFRSTKHFTINTPLPFTGSYNQVSSGRRFVIIDKPDLFCKSGYGYSADYKDAYLDVTHESLPISEEAIVLIQESQYPEIIKDETIREQLASRKVIVYRGDEATAINMVLVQEGVLPYRVGGKFMEYNPKLEEIMVQSMQMFCRDNNLEYSHNHGNMFGKGGHFSDLLDSDNTSRQEFEEEFISFLQQKLPEYFGLINSTFYQFPDRIVNSIDHTKVVEAIEEYNKYAQQDEVLKRRAYDYDRDKITPQLHDLFVSTLHQISDYYADNSHGEDITLHQEILRFFHAPTVDEQKEAAYKIQEILNKDIKQY